MKFSFLTRNCTFACILLLLTSCGFNSDSYSDEEERQSEMYIRRFKAHFDTLPTSEQQQIRTELAKHADKLDVALAKSDGARKAKLARIAHLRNTHKDDLREQYKVVDSLYIEYQHWNFDSSFVAVHQMLVLGRELKDNDLIADAKIKMSQMYISGGYFMEADRVINDVTHSYCNDHAEDNISDEMKKKLLKARFDLEFEDGFFFPWLLTKPDWSAIHMSEVYDSLAPLLSGDSYEIYRMRTSIAFHNNDYPTAAGFVSLMLAKAPQDSLTYLHDLADMGFIRMGEHNYIDGMKYMTESAIMAIELGSRNYSALRRIAELMYLTGDIERGSRYIKLAMDNAFAYNSKYRIVEASKGFPMITANFEARVRHEKQVVTIFAVILGVMVLALCYLLYYSFKQRRIKHEQAKLIVKRNAQLEQRNREIDNYNKELKEGQAVARMLVSKMISDNAQCGVLVDQLRTDVSRKIKTRQYDSISDTIDSFRKDFKKLSPDIDHVLLSFFPNFARDFNAIFPEENRFTVSPGKKLTSEMRIFAVWRIGIKKNEEIANCLGYSVNTIKAYKTKIINLSGYTKEEFYDKVMQIALENDRFQAIKGMHCRY